MTEIPLEQATFGRAGTLQLWARSAGFHDDWVAEAERLAAGFGERPEGQACPAAVFARPLGHHHVVVVPVADQGSDPAGRPAALGFHLVVMPRAAYTQLIGDPFAVAERFAPPWHARGPLPALAWPAQPLPPRTVEEVRRVLKRDDGP